MFALGFRSLFAVLAASALALLSPASASAQDRATAYRTADLSVWAGYTRTNPDYAPYTNSGFMLGADYTRHLLHLPVSPGLDARFDLGSGKSVTEHSYLAGPRFSLALRHYINPYAYGLIGYGQLTFATPPYPGYTGDTSIIYAAGGGADIPVYKNWDAKVDYQYQHWNFGEGFTITPTILTLGASYRIPFRLFNRQGDLHHH